MVGSWASFLFATVAFAAPSLPSVPEVQQSLRAIESAIVLGEVDALRLRYKELVRNRPNDPMGRVFLAWCEMPSDEAWNAFKAISAIYPENPWVHYGMGRVYLVWKMREQAALSFQTALKHQPRFYPALQGLGELARASGKHEEALEKFRSALAMHDDPQTRAGLGQTLFAMDERTEARAEMEKSIAAWPEQPALLSDLVKLLREANDTPGALPFAVKLAELRPKDVDARRTLAELRLALGDKEGAATELERLHRLGVVEAESLKRLAALYRELGKADGEERTLQQLSAVEKEVADHPLRQSELAEARGALEEAEGQLLEASVRAPTRADIHLRLARLRVRREMLKEAVEAYRAAQAAGGPEAAEAQREAAELVKQLQLPAKPARGSVDRIYGIVSASLNAYYLERLEKKPQAAGLLKLRVRIDGAGKVLGVDLLEDSVGDALLAAHVYFALKDAQYPKHKREPVFEFTLRPRK